MNNKNWRVMMFWLVLFGGLFFLFLGHWFVVGDFQALLVKSCNRKIAVQQGLEVLDGGLDAALAALGVEGVVLMHQLVDSGCRKRFFLLGEEE